jgi:UDP-N-acetylglucosamine 2-epimerase (non-hydrolysing)
MTPLRKVRILLAAGARPNFVKIAPLAAALRLPENATRSEMLLVHTGQHYDAAMSRLFFDQLDIPRSDINLEVGSASHARQTGEVMMRIEPVLADWKPDAVVVVGDVNSTLACALVAAKLGVRVAHVEAGLRSYDRTMPEEINRLLTDAISDFLFVTEPSGVENLAREGIAMEKIFLVGNVMIDSLRKFLPIARRSNGLRELGLLSESGSTVPFALLTLHRPSNVDQAETFRSLLGVLEEIGRRIPVIFPAHPRTQERMQQFGVSPNSSSLRVMNPLGYLEFLHLMSEAKFVLTDSGGIQEETTALGVPCLTLRENTERPITVEQGSNQIVGSDRQKILAVVDEILAGRGKHCRTPDLWDGRAAERIVQILLTGLTP